MAGLLLVSRQLTLILSQEYTFTLLNKNLAAETAPCLLTEFFPSRGQEPKKSLSCR